MRSGQPIKATLDIADVPHYNASVKTKKDGLGRVWNWIPPHNVFPCEPFTVVVVPCLDVKVA